MRGAAQRSMQGPFPAQSFDPPDADAADDAADGICEKLKMLREESVAVAEDATAAAVFDELEWSNRLQRE